MLTKLESSQFDHYLDFAYDHQEERYLHAYIFYTRRDTGRALAEFVDHCRARWPGHVLDLGFPAENADAIAWLEGEGIPCIERSGRGPQTGHDRSIRCEKGKADHVGLPCPRSLHEAFVSDGSSLISDTRIPDRTGTRCPRPAHQGPPSAGTHRPPAAAVRTSSGSRSRKNSRSP